MEYHKYTKKKKKIQEQISLNTPALFVKLLLWHTNLKRSTGHVMIIHRL